jgi:hypothetical protein
MAPPDTPGILYCNCTYAQIIDPAVKAAVLRQLLDSGKSFEAVADLCEMSARKDPALQRLAGGPCVKIAACYPRAVKWLFASAGAPLETATTEVLNMRELAAEPVVERLLATDVQPNLPARNAEAAAPAGDESPSARATSTEAAAS